jgi:V8-like Glu-specific endopeptidase
MKRSVVRLLGTVLAAAVMLAGAAGVSRAPVMAQVAISPGPAPSIPPPDDGGDGGSSELPEGLVRSDAVDAAQMDAVRRYWTQERIALARYRNLQSAPGELRPEVGRSAVPQRRGQVRITTATRAGEAPRSLTFAEGSTLLDVANSVALRERGAQQPEGADDREALAGNGSPGWGDAVNRFPFLFTRYRLFPDVALVRQAFPHRTVGFLLFTVPGEGDFRCTGSVVSALNGSTVWTAGHCVATPGVGFHTNFLFVPAWHGGAAAGLGQWPARTAVTFGSWINDGCLELDMATVILQATGGGTGAPAGTPIQALTGGLGFASGLHPLQHWHLMGFPAASQMNPHPPGPNAHPVPGPTFDGNHLEMCPTSFGASGEVTCERTGNFVIGAGCDQTGGSSGGPWVLDYTGNFDFLRNLLNGNNSFRFVCPGDQGCGAAHTEMELFGPYFGSAAQLLYDFSSDIEPEA